MVPPPGLQRELGRLRAEYRQLEASCAERDAGDSVALHDAQLLRLQLAGRVQRYRERGTPAVEDFAERYENEIGELLEEVHRLREENAALAFQAGDVESTAATEEEASSGLPAARSACEELREEVRQLRRRHAERQKKCRQAQLEEWRLGGLRGEARRVIKQLKAQERQLEDLRSRHAQATRYLAEASEARVKGELDLERERASIRDLHAQATGLREACYLPARLKRESSFLVRMMKQEGGQLKTRRHLQSLQVCKRLYDEVASRAPSLLPLAGRARSDMEAEFSRYLQLEDSHNRALQQLHLAVTRGLLKDGGDGCSSVA